MVLGIAVHKDVLSTSLNTLLVLLCVSVDAFNVLTSAYLSVCVSTVLMPNLVCAVLLSVMIAFINSFSVKLATTIQNVMMVIKLIALAIISIGGIYMITLGES